MIDRDDRQGYFCSDLVVYVKPAWIPVPKQAFVPLLVRNVVVEG